MRLHKPVAPGTRFNHLVVKRFSHMGHNSGAYYVCQCDCKQKTTVRLAHLKNGNTVSCGCWRKTRRLVHGMHRTPEHNAWSNAHSRCYNPKNHAYNDYGGRGITMCDRWRGPHGFENFFSDVGPRPSLKHSLDRFPNNDGNYEPGNCRWATKEEQRHNQRPVKALQNFSLEELIIELRRRGISCPFNPIPQ
jgi:hypothetical protein